ncbi:uroporphyrinogen decarboxylase-like [Oppia nitens]|uniref:uroporphyrinogen decarboxylase-like n=1 Tax=Oppia nitens TaxID=1686743 RepID=UPI0023DBDBF9|nr:uroporphyrinogen decarboxylase-like [Oppia nitens]
MNKEFAELKNDLIIRAARGERTERTPVWVMRQAGRYLQEFRQFRQKHDFFEICRTPELAAEVTLMPIRRFDLDAAIIFSDILVIPQALGMEVQMVASVGPVLPKPLVIPQNINDFLKQDIDVEKELSYVMEAITLTRHKLEGKVPLIGFSGAPFTLMGYMIEGGGSKTLSKTKKWLYEYPEESVRLLKLLTDVVIKYLVSQVKAGAQLLQVFESSAGFLGPKLFNQFSLPFIQQISSSVKQSLTDLNLPTVPMIIFVKDCHFAIESLSHSQYDVIGIDWTIEPSRGRQLAGQSVTLQGNLDPCALYADSQQIEGLVKDMIESFGTNRYIANLGHGIYPDVNPDNLAVFVNAVHKYSQNTDI